MGSSGREGTLEVWRDGSLNSEGTTGAAGEVAWATFRGAWDLPLVLLTETVAPLEGEGLFFGGREFGELGPVLTVGTPLASGAGEESSKEDEERRGGEMGVGGGAGIKFSSGSCSKPRELVLPWKSNSSAEGSGLPLRSEDRRMGSLSPSSSTEGVREERRRSRIG
jgi:hypothetical protein